MKYSIVVRSFLAALLLIAAFTDDMPYGYFQYLRYVAFLGFAWLAYYEVSEKRAITGILSIALAVLFNPILKIRLQKSDWETVDGLAGFSLVLWLIIGTVIYLIKNRRSKMRKTQQPE